MLSLSHERVCVPRPGNPGQWIAFQLVDGGDDGRLLLYRGKAGFYPLGSRARDVISLTSQD